MWNRAGAAWKSLIHEFSLVRPKLPEEVGSESMWLSSFVRTIGPGFSKMGAGQLHQRGLKKVRDACPKGRFLTDIEAGQQFGVKPWEAGA